VSAQGEANKDGGEILERPYPPRWEYGSALRRVDLRGREYLGTLRDRSSVGEIPKKEKSGDKAARRIVVTALDDAGQSACRYKRAESPTGKLERRNRGGTSFTLGGWKYIPGPLRRPAFDADYPVRWLRRGRVDADWDPGDGSAVVRQANWEQCPTWNRIMQTMPRMPVLESL